MAPLKAKILISFILLIVLLMLPDEATSQRRRRGMIASNTAQMDSLQGNDSLKADTVTVRIDSIAPVKKKQPLDAPVVYESNDSTVFTLGGAATLYGSGKVNYQNIELAAEVISMNLDSSTVHAYGIKDTTGVEKVNRYLKKVIPRMIRKQSDITSKPRKRELLISSPSREKDM